MHRLRSVIQRRRLVTAAPGDWVLGVVELMTEGRIGAIPILDGEELVGIFSERDLMTRVVVPRRDPDETRISEVMTRDVVSAGPEETVAECLDKMHAAGCRHLPVRADGRLIAMVSMRDLLSDEIEEQETEIRQLKAYLHQTPA